MISNSNGGCLVASILAVPVQYDASYTFKKLQYIANACFLNEVSGQPQGQ
jgi:hypothetical protein